MQNSKSNYMEAYEYLKDNIIHDKYPENYVFIETEIAAELGVSRTPVREALRMLRAEKLLVRIPKKGIVCRELPPSEIRTVYEMAEALEGMMAYNVAKGRSKADIFALGQCVEKMEKAITEHDERLWMEGDEEFHRKLAEFANNNFLREAMDNINIYISMIRNRYSKRNTESRETSTMQYRETWEAINAGDADYARMLVQYHWRFVRRRIMQKH